MDKRVITIHQPEHMPWLGFFNKMLKVDTFVILDSVQYKKNNWQNRNRILCNGKEHYLTVPIEIKGHTDKAIKDIFIANLYQPKWKQKYLKTISENYNKHPYYHDIFPSIEKIVNENSIKICDLNVALLTYFSQLLEARCSFIHASNLNVSGTKNDLILDICRVLDAQIYVSGSGGHDYMDVSMFEKAGVKVVFNDYIHPTYIQLGMQNFVPYLSILDMMMNVSPLEAKAIILNECSDI